MAWLTGCTLTFVQITSTHGITFLARYSHTTIWVVFILALANACYCFHKIMEISYYKQSSAEYLPKLSETDLLSIKMNEAIEREDYIKAAEIRDRLKKKSVTQSNNLS
jgi:protein-arginine kinase activator protein McsA